MPPPPKRRPGAGRESDLEEEVGRLYGLPRERFVPERDELARRLRSGGDRPAAERVSGLRKPSSAAWTVNQLARSEPRDMEALVRAGDRLREASGPAQLRAATEAERKAVSSLMRAAGRTTASSATLDRVRQTLHAMAVDSDTRRDVQAGRLERETSAVGFGPAAASSAGAPAPTRASSGLRRARAREREAQGRLSRAQAAARRSRADVERAVEAARRAQEELRRARSAARRAQTEERRAGAEVDRAAQAVARAEPSEFAHRSPERSKPSPAR